MGNKSGGSIVSDVIQSQQTAALPDDGGDDENGSVVPQVPVPIDPTTTSTTLNPHERRRTSSEKCSVLPLSMRILRSMGGVGCCRSCQSSEPVEGEASDPLGLYCGFVQETEELTSSGGVRGGISAMILRPMTSVTDRTILNERQPILERILADYRLLCQFYNCPANTNTAVMTTIRYSLPSLQVSTGFGDADMLALADLWLRYGNGPLSHVTRLDVAPRRLIRSHPAAAAGLGSHGALALAKLLQHSRYITHVRVDRNYRIGAYGATALFLACVTPDDDDSIHNNTSVTHLSMRRCSIGEKGGLAFASQLVSTTKNNLRSHCRLIHVDLSANQIGYHGCIAIERAIRERESILNRQTTAAGAGVPTVPMMILDLEGNLVLQEVMNSVTHGLGVILAFAGCHIMSQTAARQSSSRHVWSCAVYSTSLVVLYTSSTLYHSFFTMRHTKWVFEVLDKCAIYILIAGSYTPFLQIVLAHEPLWSTGLLAFLWLLCFMGVGVEFIFPTWQQKGRFSLAMYLGMGWSALICLPEVARTIDPKAIHLMALGGVAYTAGVPFFVRDNNLDHAIWHMFVMAGSIFHWCGIYFYIAPFPIAAECAA